MFPNSDKGFPMKNNNFSSAESQVKNLRVGVKATKNISKPNNLYLFLPDIKSDNGNACHSVPAFLNCLILQQVQADKKKTLLLQSEAAFFICYFPLLFHTNCHITLTIVVLNCFNQTITDHCFIA